MDDTSGELQVHVPVWEMLLHEMEKPGGEVRWEHVPAHVNVQWNEVANGLAMEGMCSSPLWSKQVQQNSSGSESTVALRGGSGSESKDTKALCSSLGMVPMDGDEMTGEASGEAKVQEKRKPRPLTTAKHTGSKSQSNSEAHMIPAS